MKTFKIAKKTNEIVETAKLDYEHIRLSGNDLCLVVKKENGLELSVGGRIKFEKTSPGNTGQMLKVCEEDATIKNIIEEDDLLYVYFEYIYIKRLTIASFLNIESEGSPYIYKFSFTDQHDMVPGDFEFYEGALTGGQEYTLYVKRGDMVMSYTGLALCYPFEIVKGKDISVEETDCTPSEFRYFNYETMEQNAILATDGISPKGPEFIPAPGDQVLLCTNPYFFAGDDGDMVLYENVSVLKYTDFMGLGVVLEQDYDAKRMYQEYQVNELFVKKIKNSIIPGFLDLEKIKYAPAFIEETESTGDTGETIYIPYLATGLTFNLHFRKRVMDKNAQGPGSQYVFEDVWHLDDTTTTWNGNGIEDTTLIKRENIYDDSGFTNSSNLIGYLGFTDDDIYNQKNRVKQTFLRLSFYDDKNPLTQNLLYYSTIFMDSGDLYGKFVKRKAWLEDTIENYDETEYPVVWSSAATTDPVCAITSQFVVNDEYDMTRSGEGFNLYLFREDAPIENESQDIYMKVEFNHAGYGRTIPLIFWRKEQTTGDTGCTDEKPVPLTIGNYLDNLYIRVRIMLTSEGYVYEFPDAVPSNNECGGWSNGIVWDNDRIYFNLFEPAIEPETGGEPIPDPPGPVPPGPTPPEPEVFNISIEGTLLQQG